MSAISPARHSGAVDLHGLRVEWHVAGLVSDPARRLFAGFAPAGERASAPDLSIRIEATRSALGAEGPDGFRSVFFQGNVRAFERAGELRLLAPAARVVISADGRRIDAEVERDTLVERGFASTTLFIAVAVALRQRGLFHMHAGAVVRRDGTRVLVLGDSGAGKSTVTLALLEDGAQHLGDDTLFLAERRGAPTLLAFPRSFHLGPRTLAAFPSLARSAGDPDTNGKRDVPADALPGRPVAEMGAPDVVLFPRVTAEAATGTLPLSPAEAFGELLRSSALLAVDGMPHATEQLRLLGALLAPARSFELQLGGDWLTDPGRAVEGLAEIPWRGRESPGAR